MATVYDVNAAELIAKAAKELEANESCKAPEWALFVKTGQHKERPPQDKNWWYARLASILRTVYTKGPIGTNSLRSKYGGKKDQGYKPPKYVKGSGSIARKALQQLEKAGFIKQTQKGVHKGRIVTPEGKKFLDKVATTMGKKA